MLQTTKYALTAILTFATMGICGLPLQPIPVRPAESGTTTIPLPTSRSHSEFLLVAGCLETDGQPIPLSAELQELPHDHVSMPAQVETTNPSEWWKWRVERDRTVMQRARERSNPATPRWVAAKFAPKKAFHLFAGEQDLMDPSRYVAVQAKLAKIGKHCLVYTDVDSQVSQSAVDEVVRVFDERVYPSARATFGEHRDVDRDGKLTILMTPWLDRLSGGKVSLSGFVRGADFYRDVEAPFSNQCDMLYLNASMKPGPHLTTIIAHEYTHAITFSEHVFGEYLPGGQGRDDEAWLSEAVAHLAENLHGDGWSNLDYRISTYLTEPNRYRLVVPDYFHEGLWRCHGARGATYLFLRHCVDRFGTGLLLELSQSNLNGIENIETATQTTFADLFRDWSVSTSVASVVGTRPGTNSPILGSLERRLLAGVRTVPVGSSDSTIAALELAPTSWTCLRVRVETDAPTQLVLRTPSGANMQFTLVELPVGLVRANLTAVPEGKHSSEVQLHLSTNRPVHWQTLTWEKMRLPQEGCDDKDREGHKRDFKSVFDETTATELELRSVPIDLSEMDGDLTVFKAVGEDEQGRPVAAWAVAQVETTTR